MSSIKPHNAAFTFFTNLMAWNCLQVYNAGEGCDVTGRQRETEVHFICSEEGKEGIKSIREHATCQYTLLFATPRLCKHPGFRAREQPVQKVICSPLGGTQPSSDWVPPQVHNDGSAAQGEPYVIAALALSLDCQIAGTLECCSRVGHWHCELSDSYVTAGDEQRINGMLTEGGPKGAAPVLLDGAPLEGVLSLRDMKQASHY